MKLDLKKLITVIKIMLVMVLIFAIIDQWFSADHSRVYVAVITLPAIFLFDIVKLKKSQQLELSYLVFLAVSAIIGSVFQLYELFDGLDKLVHFIWGIISVYFGLIVANYLKLKSKNVWTLIIFLLGITAITAIGWEVCEFTVGAITGGDPQNVQYSGVTDTMWDLINAMLGSIVVICYLYKTKKIR
jgi:hypothetical protein